MYYFGTDLRVAGHYFWDLNGDRMDKSKLSYQDIPFDPYEGQRLRTKGEVVYKNAGEFTAFVIAGSCTDGRNGTVSTFFVREKLSYRELKERILSIPIAQKMIAQMPFEVNWAE